MATGVTDRAGMLDGGRGTVCVSDVNLFGLAIMDGMKLTEKIWGLGMVEGESREIIEERSLFGTGTPFTSFFLPYCLRLSH